MNNELIWVESYRPKTIDDCILPERIKTSLKKMLETGNIQNYAAVGAPGSGKTSSARALCDQLGLDCLIINMSNESGIDTVRNKIVNYASTMSFTSNYKVIILDECLHEDEEVRVGTIDNWLPVKLKDMQFGVDYPIVSFNMDTKKFENDIGRLISDKEDDLYKVALADGSHVTLNAKHPFIVEDINGNIIEKTIEDGLAVGDKVIKML